MLYVCVHTMYILEYCRMLEHIAGNILPFGHGHFKSERTSARTIWSVRRVKSPRANTFSCKRSVGIAIHL